MSSCLGIVERFSIPIEGYPDLLDFLVMGDPQFDILISSLTNEALNTCIDLGNHRVNQKLEGKKLFFP